MGILSIPQADLHMEIDESPRHGTVMRYQSPNFLPVKGAVILPFGGKTAVMEGILRRWTLLCSSVLVLKMTFNGEAAREPFHFSLILLSHHQFFLFLNWIHLWPFHKWNRKIPPTFLFFFFPGKLSWFRNVLFLWPMKRCDPSVRELWHMRSTHTKRAAIHIKTHLSVVWACLIPRWFFPMTSSSCSVSSPVGRSGPTGAANTQQSIRCDTILERVSKKVFHHSLCSLQGRLSWEMIGFPNVGEFQTDYAKCRCNTVEVGTSGATFRRTLTWSHWFSFPFPSCIILQLFELCNLNICSIS